MPSINGCGMKTIKYAMFGFNFALVVIAIWLLWIGFSVKYGFTKYFSSMLMNGDDGGHSIPPTIFIAVGFIMLLIAFLGCCGACTENHCMMMLYSVLVGLILVIQLGGAVAAYAFQDDVEKVLENRMEMSFNEYYNTSSSEFHNNTVRTWDFLQHNLECCGVHNYSDWAHASHAPQTTFIPESCCIGGGYENCSSSITRDNMGDIAHVEKIVYTEGCLPKGVKSFAIDHMGTVGIILAVIELLGIICACLMARSIRFSYETV